MDRAIEIGSVADFARVFGASYEAGFLGEPIEQFFAHGGRRAVVVRVANGAARARLELDGIDGPLVLEARNPGRDEQLRAAVDFDGIGAAAETRFNLTLQRLDASGRRIVDQEIHSGVSVAPGEHDLAEVLATSALVVAPKGVPRSAPYATLELNRGGYDAGYATLSARGSDGDPLTDYDFVGASEAGTGLFALDSVTGLEFVHVVPATGRGFGPAFVAAAERYCAARACLLLLDPPRMSVELPAAELPASPCVVSYWPLPVTRRDRGRPVRVGAAIAGALANSDSSAVLQREFMLAADPGQRARRVAARNGFNVLETLASGQLAIPDAVTASRGLYDDVVSLATARLALFVQRAIAAGTRWAVFRSDSATSWARIEAQVGDFFHTLAVDERLEADAPEPWFVYCNRLTNSRSNERETRFVAGFVAPGRREPIVYEFVQAPAACRCRRLAYARDCVPGR